MAVFNEPAQWDHALGNNADTSTLPDDSAATAGTASLQKLFQIINATPLEAGGIAPDREDVNALFKYLGDQIFYSQNGGVSSFNVNYDYIPGRVVRYTDDNLYKCKQACGASSTVVTPDSIDSDYPGTDYWTMLLTADDLKRSISLFDLCPDGAPQHNALYRGKDITTLFTSGKFSENVADGTFNDIYPGDYIELPVTISGTTYQAKWVVGECDYALHYGGTELTEHHVLVFPDIALGTSYMNSSNTTSGGYKGSYMYNTKMPAVRTGIKNAFGSSHVCSFREYLTKTVNTSMTSMAGVGFTGASSAAEWTTVEACDIMTESMVYGSKMSSSCVDRYDFPKIISAFSHNSSLRFTNLAGGRYWWWLRDVVSSSVFA